MLLRYIPVVHYSNSLWIDVCHVVRLSHQSGFLLSITVSRNLNGLSLWRAWAHGRACSFIGVGPREARIEQIPLSPASATAYTTIIIWFLARGTPSTMKLVHLGLPRDSTSVITPDCLSSKPPDWRAKDASVAVKRSSPGLISSGVLVSIGNWTRLRCAFPPLTLCHSPQPCVIDRS